MTNFTHEDVLEYQKIIKDETGKELSLEESRESAMRMYNLVKLLVEIDGACEI